MKQRLTLSIRDFGKIDEAEVELAPTVSFVGENNSGKSYLMALLWGLFSEGYGVLFPREAPSSEQYKRCVELFAPEMKEVDFQFQTALVDWFNSLLKNQKNELIRRVLNSDDISIGHLSIQKLVRDKPLALRWTSSDRLTVLQQNISGAVLLQRANQGNQHGISQAERYRMISQLCWALVTGSLAFQPATAGSFLRRTTVRAPTYVPAARSGFMQTYRTLIADVMGAWGGQEVSSSFTRPVVDFLQKLAQAQSHESAVLNPVADTIERRMIQGQVRRIVGPVNDYRFHDQGKKHGLSYHVVSSLVGELSPLVILFRSRRPGTVFLIEEPEAHLHPELQKRMAGVLAQIMNVGVPIWFTTHSETIFQQINNLIKLHNHPNRDDLMEQYGYSVDELISPGDIKAYECVVGDDGRTRVKPLKLTEEGFEVPTFYSALRDLQKETLAFAKDD